MTWVAEAYGLDVDDLGQIAPEGIESTGPDASDRTSLTNEFRAILRDLRKPGA